MTKPILPDEVQPAKNITVPDEVLDVINNLIVKNWTGKMSKVNQTDAANMIAELLDIERQTVFDRGYLDIEDIYRKSGWEVEYVKGAYYETFSPYFTFEKSKKRC